MDQIETQGCTQSGSEVSLLPKEFRQPRFQVGDVLTLAADGGPQVQVVGFDALARSRGGGGCCRSPIGRRLPRLSNMSR